jgi:amidohydrolase
MPLHTETLARAFELEVIEYRRYLHTHPYTRWQEDPSLNWILDQVKATVPAYPWTLREEFTGGLVIDMTVDPVLPWKLFRADIDALPINENTDLPFTSAYAGVMHACGHDAHSAILLGAYRAVQRGDFVPACNIRWVWQRAEENPATPPIAESGGARLVREGVCANISFANALHIWSDFPSGLFQSGAGALMANSDRVKINVTCSGGHVANPHLGSNAARIAYNICSALEGFQSTVLDPLQTVVLEPTIIKSGVAGNVRPGEAELWFANRNFLTAEFHTPYKQRIEKRVRSVVEAYSDATCDIEFISGHPVLINDTTDFHHVHGLLQEAGQDVAVMPPTFGGEDFAYYLAKVPGSMWFLGAHQEGTGSHHTPFFNPAEAVFWRGVQFWLLLAGSNTTS